jgi:hypothetical protein
MAKKHLKEKISKIACFFFYIIFLTYIHICTHLHKQSVMTLLSFYSKSWKLKSFVKATKYLVLFFAIIFLLAISNNYRFQFNTQDFYWLKR